MYQPYDDRQGGNKLQGEQLGIGHAIGPEFVLERLRPAVNNWKHENM